MTIQLTTRVTGKLNLLATFRLEQPAWLGVAFVLTTAVVICYRYAGRAARGRWSTALPIGVLALAAAVALVYAETPTAQGLLLALALGAAAVLTITTYQRQRANLTPARRLLAGTARLVAWVALLTLIARPNWAWVIVTYEKPLLTVLLDHSESMSLSDGQTTTQPTPTRAEITVQALDRAQPALDRLDELYDVRLHRVGGTIEPIDRWEIQPNEPLSALAAALRYAGQLHDAWNEPPAAVLLISDGGENVSDAKAVRDAARQLAEQKTALLTIGVGPPADQAVSVELDPLTVPARLGTHDLLHVPVTARTQGCGNNPLTVQLLWDDQLSATSHVRAEGRPPRARAEFDTRPPGPGLHRLTARLSLPNALGGGTYETATIVDVRQDELRMLLLEGRPRSEIAFITRALQGDQRIQVTPRLLLSGDADLPDWAAFDVVVLGDVSDTWLDQHAFELLAEAVNERGVGVLLAGGRALFNQRAFVPRELERISPVWFSAVEPDADYRPRLLPTDDGLRHPVLQTGASGRRDATPDTDSEPWTTLPPLAGAAQLGPAKPLATVLAADESGQPLLVAHETGRGRCLAAAWESTWTWALASDAGLETHRRLWRQMALWLANRRPQAWVVTERPTYARAALQSGQQTVHIRAGITGIDAIADAAESDELQTQLLLRHVPPPTSAPTTGAAPAADPNHNQSIPTRRRGDRWSAELLFKDDSANGLSAGEYELEFVVSGNEQAQLVARTSFTIVEHDLERRAPTANLVLLRQAAELTTSHGGRYDPIDELSSVAQHLAATDRRRRVEQRVHYDPATDAPWVLLLTLAAAATVEWTVRKRSGLS